MSSIRGRLGSAYRQSRARNLLRDPNGVTLSARAVVDTLRAAGIRVEHRTLDARGVDDFKRRAEYEFYAPYYFAMREPVLLKKVREHYFAAEVLGLSQGQVYVDVASDISPAPLVYERLFGCKCLRQDLGYPAGRNGRRIGGPAGRMELEDATVDRMALHCALEHFEGEQDREFLREAERVLRVGGRLAIVPAYLADRTTVLSNPHVLAGLPLRDWPKFPADADLLASESGNRYERYYGPQDVIGLLQSARSLRPTLIVLDESDFITFGQLKFALVLEKGAD